MLFSGLLLLFGASLPAFLQLPRRATFRGPQLRPGVRTRLGSTTEPGKVDSLLAQLSSLSAEDLDTVIERLQPLLQAHRLSHRPQRIILVRHGESLGNLDKAAYERIPDSKIPLTRLGVEQGEEAGKQIRAIIGSDSVRFIYSPYTRTQQTLSCILKAFEGQSVELSSEPRLREQDFGNFQQVEEMEEVYKERQKFGRFYYRFPNGEAGTDVFDRVSHLWGRLTHIMDDHEQPVRNIVLVTHGLIMRILCMAYFRWTVEEFEQVWNPSNCEVWGLNRVDNTGRYELEGRWCPETKGGTFCEVRYGKDQHEPLWPHMKKRVDTRAVVAGSAGMHDDPRFTHLHLQDLEAPNLH